MRSDFADRFWKRIVASLAVLIVFTTAAIGQTGTSTVRGTVADPQGNMLSNATVTLTSSSTQTVRTQKTGASGTFSFDLIPVGDYKLDVEAPGFKKQTFDSMHAYVGLPLEVPVQLQIGTANETVRVNAEDATVQVNTQDSSLGNNFANLQIEQLPLEARNVASLLTLQPGVTKDGYVAGARSDQSNVTLDGVDINDQQNSVLVTGNNPTVSATMAGPTTGPVLRLNAEAIEEFRVSTITANAASGRSSGAQIQLVTKSGTNTLHGALFEDHRNTITTANTFFNNRNGVPRPQLIRNTFGGRIDGPIIKDKFFFMYSYEGRRDASSLPTTPRTVPLPTLGQGLVKFPNSAGGITTLTPADIATIFPDTGGENPAAVQAIAAAAAKYPANDFTVGDSKNGIFNTAGFRFNSRAPVSLNSHVAKLDYTISQKQNLFARFNVIYDHDSSSSLEFLPGTDFRTIWFHPWGYAFGHTWTISNNFVNNVRYGLTRSAISQLGDNNANHVFFRFVFDPTANTQRFARTTPVHNIVDDISWVRGNHTFQFGGNVSLVSNSRASLTSSFDSATTNPSFYQTNLIRNAVNNYLSQKFGYTIGAGAGASVENAITALLGRYTQYTGSFIFGHNGTLLPVGSPSLRTFNTQGYEGYAQDTWKIRSNLTLTAGLRYSLWRPVYETHGFEVQPNIPLSTYFDRRLAGMKAGKPFIDPITVNLSGPVNGGRPLYDWDKTNFLPKIALAWSPGFENSFLRTIFGGHDRSVLRGGFAITGDAFGEQLATSFDLNNTLGFSSSTTISANTYNVGCGPYVTISNCTPKLGPLFTSFNQNIRALPGIPAPANLTFPQQKPSDGQPRIESSLDSKLQTPKNYVWSFTFERELPKGMIFSSSYIGRLGRNLLATRDIMALNNLVDPKSGMDWYTAATMLEKLRQAAVPCGSTPAACTQIAPIAYFENLFPGVASGLGFNTGFTATQAIYRDAFRFNGNDWTTTQLDIDTLSNVGPHAFYQPQYGALSAFSTIGNSNYHALAVSLRQRMHKLMYDFNYTYSHSLDDASGLQASATYGAAFILNPILQRESYANSDFDMRHQININSILQLPFGRGQMFGRNASGVANAIIGGWQLSNIFRWNSGLPVGYYGDSGPFDDARWATNWEVQSNVVPTKPIHECLTRGATPQVFGCNTTVAYQTFRNAYPGEAGPRNIFRVPGFVTLDAGLDKSFNIPGKEGQMLQFRWEVFNVTNTQPMGQYDNSRTGFGVTLDPSTQKPPVGWSSFTNTQGSPRVMQFGVRYSF